jgi:hypothetical protein
MNPIRRVMSLVPVLTLVLARMAAAQTSPLHLVPDPPVAEIGADLGVFNFMGWSLFGGHVTHNYTGWLAGEAGLHGASGDERTAVPGYAVFVADVRLQGQIDDRRLGFVTVGAARAFGLSYEYSPVLGLGMQSTWKRGSAGWRFDAQWFPRGKDLYGGNRVMLGLVLVL